jgi:hypothetical protein
LRQTSPWMHYKNSLERRMDGIYIIYNYILTMKKGG